MYRVNCCFVYNTFAQMTHWIFYEIYLIVYATSISYWSLGSLCQFCIRCPVGLILNITNRWSTYNCFASAYTLDFLCQFYIRWSVGLSTSFLCNFNCWICCLFCLKSSVRLSILVLFQMTRMSVFTLEYTVTILHNMTPWIICVRISSHDLICANFAALIIQM